MSAISKPRCRRINIVRAIKALSAAVVMSVPTAISTVQSAQAYTWYSSAQNAAADAAYSNFRSVRLTDTSLKNLVCYIYSFQTVAINGGCERLSSAPGFWEQAPRYYRLVGCDPNDAGRYTENLYLTLNDPNSNTIGGATDSASGYLYSASFPPPANLTTTINYCSAAPSFDFVTTHAFGFGNAAADEKAIFMLSSRSFLGSPQPKTENEEYGAIPVFRTGDLSAPLSFDIQIGGSVVPGTDYNWRDQTNPSNPPANTNIGRVNFLSISNASGQSADFNNFFLYVIPQTTDRPERLITATINNLPAGYKLGGAQTITYALAEVRIAQVSLTNAGSSLNLGYGNNPGFTISRQGGDLTQPLTVNYNVAGTASNGTDYNYLDGSLSFAAGQTTATIPLSVNSPGGSAAIPAKDLQITINPDSANGTVYKSQSPKLSYTIPAYNPAALSVGVGNSGTANRGETTEFTIGRDPNGDLSQPLTVNYKLGGTATPGADYKTTTPGTSGSVTIPAGQATADVPITVPSENGTAAKPTKDVTLTVAPGNGYALPNPAPSGTLTIPAYSPSAVAITNDGSGFTFTRPATDAGKPLTLNYALGGTATNGTDYKAPGNGNGSITIPADQTSATLPVDVKPNGGSTLEPEETIVMDLRPGSGYDSTAVQPSTITIPAYTPLTSSTSSNPPTFVLTRPGNSDLNKPVTVPYQVAGGSGQSGKDYGMPASGVITIPAGQTVGSVPVNVLPTATPGKTVGVTLTPPPGFGVTNPNLSYAIQDADIAKKAPVELMGTVQPDGGLLITRPAGDKSNPLDLPYIVTVKNNNGTTDVGSGVLTFAPGVESNSIPASKLPQVSKDGGTISYDVKPPAGYSIDNSKFSKVVPATQAIPQVGVTTNSGGSTGGNGGGDTGNSGGNTGGGNNGGGGNTGNGGVQQTNPSFTIDRKPGSDLNQPVTIAYEVSGTAVPGVDYVALPGSVTIPAGQTSATTQIKLLKDPSELAGKTISIRLLDGTTYDLATGQGSGDITIRKPRNQGSGVGGTGTTVTGSTSGSSDDSSSSGGGSGSSSALLAIPAVGVLGTGVLAATGGFGGNGLLAANTCPANYSLPAGLQQLAEKVDTDGTVNWDQIRFSVLPQVDKKPAAMAFTLGQFGDSMGKMSLKDIARVTGQDMSGMTLSALLGLNPAAKVSDIPGLAAHIAVAEGAANKQATPIASAAPVTAETALSMLLAQRPAMRSMTLGEIDGVMDMELQSISNWQQIPVGQVPGLAEASFDKLFPCLVQTGEYHPTYDRKPFFGQEIDPSGEPCTNRCAMTIQSEPSRSNRFTPPNGTSGSSPR